MVEYTLTVAAKAPQIAYPSLIAAAFVSADESSPDIVNIKYVDDKQVSAESPNSALEFTGSPAPIYSEPELFSFLAEQYPALFRPASSGKAVDEWISRSADLGVKDFKKVTSSLEQLEAHLNFRSFLAGYAASLADIAAWGTLRANSVVASVVRNGTFANIARWYLFLERDFRFGGVVEAMTKSVNELRKASKAGTKKESKASFDIDLIGAEMGKVVTRFPPEPSGYLHIGHAKAAVLNQYFAELYKGKLIIRFDDTNPSKEKEEFQDSILEDLALLGIKGDQITYSSDYFDQMYAAAQQMIKEGKAYCDDTPQEQMRLERGEGIPSKRRDRSVEENLRIFTQEMAKGTPEGLKNCLRAKISVDAPNKTLRDPVIYRCNLTPHHRTGDKWKVYPTYDFCVPFVDALEGVTHALRTIEYRDRNAQYDWMLEALHLRKVHIWDFSRVNFVRTLLSKRKLQWFVDKGLVPGWDDPRFPTVRGVRRRGMTVEGLRNFIISQGPSRNILNLDWNLIWAMNKKVIDPIAPRYSCVYADKVVPVTVAGGPEPAVVEQKPKHKKNPDLGTKPVVYSRHLLIDQDDAVTLEEGEEITLMDWGNAIVKKITKNESGVVTAIDMDLHLEGDFKTTSKKLSWIAETEENVPLDLVDFDHLITKEKLEEGDNFEDFLTPETEFHVDAIGDANIAGLKEGDIIQFERKGYYRLDKEYQKGVAGSKAVFFTIPDGKSVQRYGAKPKE